MTCERFADLLDAYADGEADALSARAVEDHLAQCAACSAQMAARRSLQNALREKLTYHRAPESLVIHQPWRDEVKNDAVKTEARRGRSMVFRYAIAACVTLAAGIAIGLGIHPASPDMLASLVQTVEMDHLRSLQGEHLFDVPSTDQHTVKPWFAGKLSFAPPVPNFEGFPLRGGRLDWVDGTQAAALVYARNEHTINLFIWPAKDSALPASTTARVSPSGHHVLLWSDGPFNFAAISDVDTTQLAEFATAFRAATNSAPK